MVVAPILFVRKEKFKMTKYLRPDPKKEYRVHVLDGEEHSFYTFTRKREAKEVMNFFRESGLLPKVTTIYGGLSYLNIPQYVKDMMSECSAFGAKVWYVEA